MLDNKKIASYIANKRKSKGLTQQQVADALNISFQAVSKWESGAIYPSIESISSHYLVWAACCARRVPLQIHIFPLFLNSITYYIINQSISSWILFGKEI